MEKTSEIMKELANSKKINVEKNNGIKERFSYEKLLKSLVMVETPFFESDKIVAQVVSSLYDGIKTKEIKKIVYECLEDIDGEIANKYLASTQLKVRTSRDTIEAFDFDVSKFWYLLLFVYDFIEDIGTDAPTVEKPLLEDFASFLTNLCGASSITLKQGDKNIYSTEREDLIDIIQRAVYHFGETYSKIVNGEQDLKTKIKQLQKLGLKGFIDNSLLSQINFNGKYTLDYSHKRWKFAEMFLYFLEGKKADKKRVSDRNVRISTEKNLFVSRLLYTTGYVSEVYDREFFPNGKPNRTLSLIIRKYSKEKFPPVIANNYNAVAL